LKNQSFLKRKIFEKFEKIFIIDSKYNVLGEEAKKQQQISPKIVIL